MLEDDIKSIREGLKAAHYINQASISQGIVLRMLQTLGWPTYDIKVVSPEYPLDGRRVDFALCHPPGKPIVLIEVKPVGQSGSGERQLFEYAFHKGVPMAILTDGQEWHFFLPGEPGDYGERRVYKLDIVEREISESVTRLGRYLKYDSVCSGAALQAARNDYQDVARNRIVKETLPKAFLKLIEEEEELFLELVAEQVESLCGYKPDLDTVASFLKSNIRFGTFVHPQPTFVPPKPQPETLPKTPKEIGFGIQGRWYPARNARDVLIKVFTNIAEQDPGFLDRFASLPKHGRVRRYLARSQEDLYPNRPDLARDHSYELKNGWWIGVNLSKGSIEKLIKMACDVAQIKYGDDLLVNLGD